jgi:hypothetical protein
MKPYTDVFKKPLDKKEVATVVMVVIMQKTTSVIEVQRYINIGAGKLNKIFQLLEDAGVITSEPRSILLNRVDAATNAAFRQLKKGKK